MPGFACAIYRWVGHIPVSRVENMNLSRNVKTACMKQYNKKFVVSRDRRSPRHTKLWTIAPAVSHRSKGRALSLHHVIYPHPLDARILTFRTPERRASGRVGFVVPVPLCHEPRAGVAAVHRLRRSRCGLPGGNSGGSVFPAVSCSGNEIHKTKQKRSVLLPGIIM